MWDYIDDTLGENGREGVPRAPDGASKQAVDTLELLYSTSTPFSWLRLGAHMKVFFVFGCSYSPFALVEVHVQIVGSTALYVFAISAEFAPLARQT